MRRGVPVAGALAPDGVSFYFVDARDPNRHEELTLSLGANGPTRRPASLGTEWGCVAHEKRP
jgi:hypothetical protein